MGNPSKSTPAEGTPGEIPPKHYRRMRCDNCFAPTPKRTGNKRFCSDQCRKEFHRHGSAFGPLRVKLEKIIAQATRELRAELEAAKLRIARLEAR